MKRTTIIFSLAVIALLSLTSLALSAANSAGILSAYTIHVQQDAPITLTVGVPLDGEIITATVPLTIGIDLRITVDGAMITTTTPSSATITIAPVEAGDLDSSGRIVEYDLPPTIEIGQVRSGETDSGQFEVIAEVTNIGKETLGRPQLVITSYDSSGLLLKTDWSFLALSEFAPGQTTGADVTSDVEAAAVTRYVVQVDYD